VKRNRTVREQVKSGFRIAGAIILSFLVFAGLVISAGYLVTPNNGPPFSKFHLLGGLSLVALATLLFLTTRIWAQWLIGILGYCFLKLLIGGFIVGLDRKIVTFYLLYLLAAIALTFRHVRRKPTGTERIGLVGFVVGIAFAMKYESYLPLLVGLALLGCGELVEQIRRAQRKQHYKTARASQITTI
jgi:hypothetical protein